MAAMLICTNDGFTGIDTLALPESGSQTVETNGYDAGTENNTEDFAHMVPPCQGLVGVSSGEEGTGTSDPALAEGGVVSPHAGILGGIDDLTVADHGWIDPVARVTISAEATGLPSTGGPPLGDSSGVSPITIIALALGSALGLAGIGMALRARRVRFQAWVLRPKASNLTMACGWWACDRRPTILVLPYSRIT